MHLKSTTHVQGHDWCCRGIVMGGVQQWGHVVMHLNTISCYIGRRHPQLLHWGRVRWDNFEWGPRTGDTRRRQVPLILRRCIRDANKYTCQQNPICVCSPMESSLLFIVTGRIHNEASCIRPEGNHATSRVILYADTCIIAHLFCELPAPYPGLKYIFSNIWLSN